MSSQLSSMRTRRGSPLAIVPATTALPVSPSRVRVTSEANVPASEVLRSFTVMPRFLARNAALMRLTRSVVAFSRTPRSAAAVSCEASWSARSPATSTVRVLTRAAEVLRRDPAEDHGQGQVGRDRPGRLRREQRGVDGVAGRPAGQDVDDLLAGLLGHAQLGLGREGAEVRRQDGVGGRQDAASRPAAPDRRRRRRRRRSCRR